VKIHFIEQTYIKEAADRIFPTAAFFVEKSGIYKVRSVKNAN
jgi:hypothetical protein